MSATRSALIVPATLMVLLAGCKYFESRPGGGQATLRQASSNGSFAFTGEPTNTPLCAAGLGRHPDAPPFCDGVVFFDVPVAGISIAYDSSSIADDYGLSAGWTVAPDSYIGTPTPSLDPFPGELVEITTTGFRTPMTGGTVKYPVDVRSSGPSS